MKDVWCDLLVCDDIKAMEYFFYFPPQAEKRCSAKWKALIPDVALGRLPVSLLSHKNWLQKSLWREAGQQTALCWMTEQRIESQEVVCCVLSLPPSEHSAGVIIWQKTLWNRSDSCNYDEDEAWLLCRPSNFCIDMGHHAAMDLGGLGGNQDVAEFESSWLVLIQKGEDELKYERHRF